MRRLAIVIAVALATATGAAAAGTTDRSVLTSHGLGPLRLGMTYRAAAATGWLGAGLDKPRYPGLRTRRVPGARGPGELVGAATFQSGRLAELSFTQGAQTTNGARIGGRAQLLIRRFRRTGAQVTVRRVRHSTETIVVVDTKRGLPISALVLRGRITELGVGGFWSSSPPSAATAAHPVLSSHGVGPLRLGMSLRAARATAWLKVGKCGPPVYRLVGHGVRGAVDFLTGHLDGISVSGGVITSTGVQVGDRTTTLGHRYSRAGDDVDVHTFDG